MFIKDLKVTLGPRQAIDLDKVVGREKSEESEDLKEKTRGGFIEIKRKDQISSYRIKEEPQIKDNKAEFMSEIKNALKDMKDELKEGMTKPSVGISKEDLMSTMKEVMADMPQASNTVIMQEVEKNISRDFDVQMDESLFADMNKRAVNQIVKDVRSAEVKYKEEKQKNSIIDNINELEGLL